MCFFSSPSDDPNSGDPFGSDLAQNNIGARRSTSAPSGPLIGSASSSVKKRRRDTECCCELLDCDIREDDGSR